MSGAAWAVPVIPEDPGGVYASFNNWTSLTRYNSQTQQYETVLSGTPQTGDEIRSLYEAQVLKPNSIPLDTSPNGAMFWPKGAGEEISGLGYNLFVPGNDSGGVLWEWQGGSGGSYMNVGSSGQIGTNGTTYFVSEGNRLDLWLDTSPDFWDPAGAAVSVPAQGPDAWVDSTVPTPDAYPGATDLANDGVNTDPDAVLYISASYVPLFADFNQDYYRDPGEPDLAYWDPSGDDYDDDGVWTDPSGDDVAIVRAAHNYDVGQKNAHAYGWLDINAGYLLDSGILDEDHLDLSGNAFDYDMYVLAAFGTGADGWPATSFDPMIFAVVPEPSTVLLFSQGVLLLAAGAWRRMRKH